MFPVLVVTHLLLAVYCVLDLLPREEAQVKVLPKPTWLVVVVVFVVLGPAAYLLAGRVPPGGTPRVGGAGGSAGGWDRPRPAVRGPEDDEAFQAQLRRRVEEQRRRAREQRPGDEPR